MLRPTLRSLHDAAAGAVSLRYRMDAETTSTQYGQTRRHQAVYAPAINRVQHATVSALPATSAIGAVPTPDFIQPGSTFLDPACEVALNNTLIAMFDCGVGYDEKTDKVKSNIPWGSATICLCTPAHRAVFSSAKSTCVKDASDAESMKDFVDGMQLILDGCREAFSTSEPPSGNDLSFSSSSSNSNASINVPLVVGIVCGVLALLIGALVFVFIYRRGRRSRNSHKKTAESGAQIVENTPSILTRGELAYASSDGETVSILSLTSSEKAPLPSVSPAFAKPQLMSFLADSPTFDLVDPAEWNVAQTVSWLTSLNYPAQVVASFEGAGVDGMFLKVLSKTRESCKEALKNDLQVDNVRTRALLADSIVSLFEARADGLTAGELPGYSG
ncbi:hypothetical protein BJ741DRAFT_588626 [Chytriomyces cf. hyalinus JEL632]|nr:hypothetical protein BJ741DRAFT_588626 [Chytriomyces cf. hyalinus JEL632]